MAQYLINGRSLIMETIQRIKEYEPPKGYYLAFSGGKDSICIYNLSKAAGVKYHAVYHFTTIDPRGLPQFIRDNYPDVKIEKPTYKGKPTNFYALVAQKGLPWRRRRWCCQYLKESGGEKGSTVMVGVRREESVARREREMYYKYNGRWMFLPIYDWKEADVWDYIHDNNLPYPRLYDQGLKRLGCVLCPLACRKARIRDYHDYPERIRLIEKQVGKYIKRDGIHFSAWGETPEEIVRHWVYDSPVKSAKGTCMQTQLKESKGD